MDIKHHHNRNDEDLTPAEYKLITEEALEYQQKVGFTKGVMAAFQYMRCNFGVTLEKIDQMYDAMKEQERNGK